MDTERKQINTFDWKEIIFLTVVLIVAVVVLWHGVKGTANGGELYVAKMWCDQREGKTEFVLAEHSRVDCLLDEYAVEVEYAHKWQEAVGQAMYYSIVTERKPGIVVIREKNDHRFIRRLVTVADKLGIAVWYIEYPSKPTGIRIVP